MGCRTWLRRNQAHSIFGQGGDGQAGVDPGIAWHDRTIHHIQSWIIVNLAVDTDHPLLIILTDWHTTQM